MNFIQLTGFAYLRYILRIMFVQSWEMKKRHVVLAIVSFPVFFISLGIFLLYPELVDIWPLPLVIALAVLACASFICAILLPGIQLISVTLSLIAPIRAALKHRQVGKFIRKLRNLDDIQYHTLRKEYPEAERIRYNIQVAKSLLAVEIQSRQGVLEIYTTQSYIFARGFLLLFRDEIERIDITYFAGEQDRLEFVLKNGQIHTLFTLDNYSYRHDPQALGKIMAWFWQCDPNAPGFSERVYDWYKQNIMTPTDRSRRHASETFDDSSEPNSTSRKSGFRSKRAQINNASTRVDEAQQKKVIKRGRRVFRIQIVLAVLAVAILPFMVFADALLLRNAYTAMELLERKYFWNTTVSAFSMSGIIALCAIIFLIGAVFLANILMRNRHLELMFYHMWSSTLLALAIVGGAIWGAVEHGGLNLDAVSASDTRADITAIENNELVVTTWAAHENRLAEDFTRRSLPHSDFNMYSEQIWDAENRIWIRLFFPPALSPSVLYERYGGAELRLEIHHTPNLNIVVEIIDMSIPDIDNAVIEIGNIAEFGGIYWRILDIQNGRVLLLSEYVLGLREFHEQTVVATWATSNLRKYLNEEFLYNRFTAEERARIVETTVVNYGCRIYPGRVDDTVDQLFLLSIDEILLYLSGNGEWSGEGSFIDDQYNAERVATLDIRLGIRGDVPWWLRSSGGEMPDGEPQAMVVSDDGRIAVWGRRVTLDGGVRPAMWLYLELLVD